MKSPIATPYYKPTSGPLRREAGFTLAEVLAAMALIAIVIPVAVEALELASRAGVAAARKPEAARVAEQVLNESVAMATWTSANQNGSRTENGNDFQWTLRASDWPADSAMQVLTAEVTYSAHGRPGTVRLATLVKSP